MYTPIVRMADYVGHSECFTDNPALQRLNHLVIHDGTNCASVVLEYIQDFHLHSIALIAEELGGRLPRVGHKTADRAEGRLRLSTLLLEPYRWLSCLSHRPETHRIATALVLAIVELRSRSYKSYRRPTANSRKALAS